MCSVPDPFQNMKMWGPDYFASTAISSLCTCVCPLLVDSSFVDNYMCNELLILIRICLN